MVVAAKMHATDYLHAGCSSMSRFVDQERTEASWSLTYDCVLRTVMSMSVSLVVCPLT